MDKTLDAEELHIAARPFHRCAAAREIISARPDLGSRASASENDSQNNNPRPEDDEDRAVAQVSKSPRARLVAAHNC